MKKFCAFSLLLSAIIIFPNFALASRQFDQEEENDATTTVQEAKNTVKNQNNKNNAEKKPVQKKEKSSVTEYYNQAREAYMNFNVKGYENAISLYNKALEIDKNYAKAIAGKAEAQALLSKIIYDSTGDIKESSKFDTLAFENAYIAHSINDDIPETHRALSMVYFVQKKYEEGREEATKAIKIDESDAESHLLLWLNSPDNKLIRRDNSEAAYYKALNLESQNLEKAFDLNPDLQLSHLELAKTLTYQDEYFKAISQYKKLININPNSENAYIALANLYNQSSLTDQAISQFEKALEIDPERYDAIYGLGLTYLKKKDTPQAQEYLNKACDYDYIDACDFINRRGSGMRPYRRVPKTRRQFSMMSF